MYIKSHFFRFITDQTFTAYSMPSGAHLAKFGIILANIHPQFFVILSASEIWFYKDFFLENDNGEPVLNRGFKGRGGSKL